MIAGTEMMAIGFHAMVEPGNRKGREARMMAANRAVASEMYAISLFIFMPSSIWVDCFSISAVRVSHPTHVYADCIIAYRHSV